MYSETEYYKISEDLLRAVGLWSTRHTRLKVLQNYLAYSILFTGVLVQSLVFFTSKCNWYVALRVLTTLCPSLAVIVRYYNFNIYSTETVAIMDRVKGDWEFVAQTNYEDLRVLHMYSQNIRFISVLLRNALPVVCIGSIPMYLFPCLLDIAMPLNETRTRHHFAEAEYFIDQQEYFYPIFLHMIAFFIVGFTTIIATDVLLTLVLLHSCGMLKIAGCRMERAADVAFPNRYDMICSRVTQAVCIQKRAIELHDDLWSTFGPTYCVQTAIGVISISVNLLRVFEAVTSSDNISEVLDSGVFMVMQLIYLSLDQFRGQYLMQCSASVFDQTYNARWYVTSAPAQRLFLLVMQGSMKEMSLSFFGVFTISLEGCSTIVSLAVSYFTVMSSVRDK